MHLKILANYPTHALKDICRNASCHWNHYVQIRLPTGTNLIESLWHIVSNAMEQCINIKFWNKSEAVSKKMCLWLIQTVPQQKRNCWWWAVFGTTINQQTLHQTTSNECNRCLLIIRLLLFSALRSHERPTLSRCFSNSAMCDFDTVNDSE